MTVARSRDSFDVRQESLNPTPLLKMNFDKISADKRPAVKEKDKLKDSSVAPKEALLSNINTEKPRHESIEIGTEF